MSRERRIQVRELEGRATLSRLVSFSIIAATLATFLGGYQFGSGAFIDFHPIVRGLMDSGYLANDFFVSVGREFGPRLFFAWVFAVLAPGPDSLPVIYFVTTLSINVAIAVLTGLLTRDIFQSDLAGMFAVAASMSCVFFSLAGSGFIFADHLNANRLAFPLAFAGVWAAVRVQPLLVGLTTGLATLMHPVFGLEVGLLLLASMAVVALISASSARARVGRLVRIGGGTGVLALFSLAVLIPYSGEARIPGDILFDILLLRSSHEMIPAEFGFEWVSFGLFLVGAGMAWVWSRSGRERDEGRLLLGVFAVSILVSLAAGFVSMAYFPSRLGAITNPLHRLAILLGWLGFVAIAGNAAKQTLRPPGSVGVFLYSTVISPISVGLGHLLFGIKRRWGKSIADGEHSSVGVAWVLLAVLSLLVGAALTAAPRYLVLFVVVTGVGAWMVLAPRRLVAHLIPAALTVCLAVALITVQATGRGPRIVDDVGPEILPAHLDGPVVDIARRSKNITPSESLFVTPPGFGAFRITADRAIIGDFTAFPFQETAILEWRTRMLDQYGTPTTTGAAAQAEFDESYRAITDLNLRSLCQKYGATHAILYAETDTNLTVLDANEVYVLVVLDDCSPG